MRTQTSGLVIVDVGVEELPTEERATPSRECDRAAGPYPRNPANLKGSFMTQAGFRSCRSLNGQVIGIRGDVGNGGNRYTPCPTLSTSRRARRWSMGLRVAPAPKGSVVVKNSCFSAARSLRTACAVLNVNAHT